MDTADALAIAGYAISVGVALLLGVSGAAKVRHRAALEGVVANYRLLPGTLVAPVALALPWIELALAATLAAGVRPWPQWLAAALLAVFAAAMAINIRRGRSHIDCGCGISAMRQPLDRAAVARNVVLALPLVAAGATRSVPDLAAGIAAVTGGAALFLIYLVFNAIGALSRTSPAAMGR